MLGDNVTAYPPYSHQVVADENATRELSRDPLPHQDLLEVRELRLVDEHRCVPCHLVAKKQNIVE